MTGLVMAKESFQCRATLGLVVIVLSIVGCGGPSSPDPPTEAQVISNTTWSGFFGRENRPMSGTGSSEILSLGTGRHCAVVTKTGTGTLTIRVAEGRESTGNHEFSEVVTACGTGPLR